MIKFFFLGIGFMLLIEGLLYFFFTHQMKAMMKIIEDIEPIKIKTISTVLSIVGAGLIYFIFNNYDIET